MPSEFVYENPPLREVIVEYRWALTTLKVVQGVRIDPFYQVLLQKFTSDVAKIGFEVVESRIPDNAPIELFSYQPTRLFRAKPNAWPIFQIGPGIFTANATPPYGGWSSFMPHIKAGLDILFKIYPEDFLSPQRISLRYINGFVASHGMLSQAAFIRDTLKLAGALPAAIRDCAEGGIRDILQTGRIRVPLSTQPQSTGEVIWNAGRVKGEDAVILEFKAITSAASKSSDKVLAELNASHDIISRWFEGLVDENVRRHFGPSREVKNDG